METKLKLRVGCKYKTRDGNHVVEITEYAPEYDYPFSGPSQFYEGECDYFTFTEDGRFDTTYTNHKFDLVEEVIPISADHIDQHTPGAKLDQDKPDMDLVLGGFAASLTEVAKIGTFGAKKYTPNGWKEVPNAQRRYGSALLRHKFKDSEGESIDPESGYLHLAHAAWNALAILEFKLKEVNGT